MKKNWLLFVTVGLALILVTDLTGCTSTSDSTPTPTPTNLQPIEVVSMSGPLQPINPGGPIVEINLKNVSDESVVSLIASLELSRSFRVDYDVNSSNPLLPNESISSRLTLIGGGFSDAISYPLTISGTFQSGKTFAYTKQVQIGPTPAPITSPPPPRTDWEEGSPPPAGIQGLEKPRPLTEDEKAEVVEIAFSSQRVSEWLQGSSDYRTGPIDWYAIIWNSNAEAGTWWSLEHDRVANEGIPDFVSPYALWYPGVTIAVGEGTIYQMQIAVDLDAGKTAMVMGPYPSLSSPDRFKNIPEPSPDNPSIGANIEVEPDPGSYLTAGNERSGVILKDVQVKTAICDRDYFSPWFPAPKKGDPCLVVGGHIENQDKEKFEISMSALGYDGAGETVSGTVDAAHIAGAIGLHLEFGETGEFTIHLNYSDEVKTIRISAANSLITPP